MVNPMEDHGPEVVEPRAPATERQADPFRFKVNLVNADGEPELEQEINLALGKILADCQRRAGLDSKRSLVLKLHFKPVMRRDGTRGAARVIVESDVSVKVPNARIPATKEETISLPVMLTRDEDGRETVHAGVPVAMAQPDFLNDDYDE